MKITLTTFNEPVRYFAKAKRIWEKYPFNALSACDMVLKTSLLFVGRKAMDFVMEETVKSCTTCIFGSELCCSNDILCSKKGVLSTDAPCKKYEEDLTKRVVRKKRTVKINVD